MWSPSYSFVILGLLLAKLLCSNPPPPCKNNYRVEGQVAGAAAALSKVLQSPDLGESEQLAGEADLGESEQLGEGGQSNLKIAAGGVAPCSSNDSNNVDVLLCGCTGRIDIESGSHGRTAIQYSGRHGCTTLQHAAGSNQAHMKGAHLEN